jgi:hypothetical protein
MSGTRWSYVVVLVASWVAGGWLAATWVGTALDGRPPPLAAITAVAVALVGVGVAPALLAVQLRRQLRARSWEVELLPLWATTAGLGALAVVVGAQVAQPGGLGALLTDRSTWLLDAATGDGPFGTAAAGVAEARLAELASPVSPARTPALLCGEAAGAVARGIAEAARVQDERLPSPRAEALDSAVAQVEANEGAAALTAAVAAVEATAGTGPFTFGGTRAWTLASAARTRLVFIDLEGAELAVLRERGQWRVCPTVEQATEVGARWTAEVRALAIAALPVAPAPDPSEALVRTLLASVVEGRASWALGVPAAPGFAAAFGGSAAVAEAERIRGWCRALAAGDPGLAGAVSALDARWAASPERLPTEGTALLTEVELACGPVAGARVLVEAARGVPAPQEERRRWARLDGEAAARTAILTRDGASWRAVVPVAESGAGPVFTFVPDAAGWRVESVH